MRLKWPTRAGTTIATASSARSRRRSTAPHPHPPTTNAVSVGSGLNISDSEIGDVIAVRGAVPAGAGVEVLRDAKLTKVKTGDIFGFDMGTGKKP